MRYKKMIVVLGIMGILSSSLTLTVSANNSADKPFKFNFHYLNGVIQTEAREKKDASSSYIKASELPFGGMEVRINGTGTLYRPLWTNETVGRAYLNVTNAGRFIHQYVFEHKNKYAQLEGRKPGQTEAAWGVWSPDSVGSYPAINQ